MYKAYIPEDIKEKYRYAINQVRKDRQGYFDWIKNQIEIATELINKFDKIYVLGGLGARLIKSSPTSYNQFLQIYDGPDKEEIKEEEIVQKDDEIEVLLEYAMSIATATPNSNKNVIPTQEDIQSIYGQLSKIKANINFWELSADMPADGNEFGHWLRTNIMLYTINVRGDGYHTHIEEVYHEMFQPYNGFLERFYGFNADDIYKTILKLDSLVYSKVGNLFGGLQSHKRLTEWMEETGEETIKKVTMETGKDFIRQFAEVNPDLFDESAPDHVVLHHLAVIESYRKVFWVIPKSDKEKLIFEKFSLEFGRNTVFFEPSKFKAFPLNDTSIKLKPLIKEDGKYFHFSHSLAFRNIFNITEEFIRLADAVYFQNYFKGNTHSISKDNYVELKTKRLFQKILPTVSFFHSLEYSIIQNGQPKNTELDILGISADTIYIIEVKAGELNPKHRRGALKGLKDRLQETINEGSYRCHRALKYILENPTPTFEYVEAGTRKTLTIEKSQIRSYFKISVTFEHFSSISANLKFLIHSGVLSADLKWTWIVSIYDLMVFADLIESEKDFKEYLTHRMALYDRNDIEFLDEIDILGFYFGGNFPLGPEKEKEMIQVVNYKDDIETYYTKRGVGMSGVIKPIREKKK